MEQWQQRVIEEQKELEQKLKRLNGFFDGPNFPKLPSRTQHLMTAQFHAMAAYEIIISLRIEEFSNAPCLPK